MTFKHLFVAAFLLSTTAALAEPLHFTDIRTENNDASRNSWLELGQEITGSQEATHFEITEDLPFLGLDEELVPTEISGHVKSAAVQATQKKLYKPLYFKNDTCQIRIDTGLGPKYEGPFSPIAKIRKGSYTITTKFSKVSDVFVCPSNFDNDKPTIAGCTVGPASGNKWPLAIVAPRTVLSGFVTIFCNTTKLGMNPSIEDLEAALDHKVKFTHLKPCSDWASESGKDPKDCEKPVYDELRDPELARQ